MRVLELFSGTKSIGKVCDDLGYETISLDVCDYRKKYIPTHKEDILTFNYKQYPVGHFDIITASPPCIYYSLLQNTWIGREKRDPISKEKYIYTIEIHNERLKLADKWVKKTLEIIEYFKPKYWWIENPQTGLLKKRTFMKDVPYYDVDYCKYSNYGYRKRTRFWTNIKGFEPKLCKTDCDNLQRSDKGRLIHKRSLGGNSKIQKAVGGGNYRLERYRIPPILIKDLLACCI